VSGAPSRWERLALAAGVAFALAELGAFVFAMAFVVPTHAPVGSPPAETAAALGRYAPRIAVGTYLVTLPVPFLLLFLGGLVAVLRRAEGGGAPLTVAAAAAGVALAVVGPLGAVLSGLSAAVANLGGDPAVVAELDSITPLALALAGYPKAVLLGTTATLVLHGRLGPRWLAWTGYGVALLGLASTATIAARTLFPLVALQQVLFPLWIIALAGTLLARLPRPTPETTGTAGAPEQPYAGHLSPAGRVPQRRHAS
jgi:hypothetical protein